MDAGCWILDQDDIWILEFGAWNLAVDARCRMLDAGCWISSERTLGIEHR